jgi:hypothetical protein
VAVAHLADLQAEQVLDTLAHSSLRCASGSHYAKHSLQVEVRAKIKAHDDVKHVLDHKAEAAANR